MELDKRIKTAIADECRSENCSELAGPLAAFIEFIAINQNAPREQVKQRISTLYDLVKKTS